MVKGNESVSISGENSFLPHANIVIAQSLLAKVFYCLVPSTDGVLPGRFLLSKAQLA